jgi:hypothetical protein
MTVIRKKPQRSFPRRKVRSIVQGVLPKGQSFKLQLVDSNIRNMKIVRIVTPAWKRLSPSERIHKMILAANTELKPEEIKSILRFSVLTPEEYKSILPPKPRKNGNLVKK